MRYLLALLLVLSALFASSCNQNMLGGAKAVKNVLTSPYRGIKGAISNSRYNGIKERTPKESVAIGDVKCAKKVDPVLASGENIENLLDNVREGVCGCRPWGSCSTKECACEVLCPNSLEIFKRRDLVENSDSKNSLAFRNADISDNHEMTQGYCWGHASITTKFNRMAFFNKSKKAPYNINSQDRGEYKKAIAYYKKKIDAVINNEATDIEGFSNLQDFSDHPDLQGYLGDKMAQAWADRAMTFQALGVGLNTKGNSKKGNQKFFSSVLSKLDNHQQPQIVFTSGRQKFLTHAVLISHAIKENGRTVLCVRDNNSSPLRNKRCQNKIFMNSRGKVVYNSWGELGGIKLAHNDNSDAVEQFSSLRKKCTKTKGCSK